MYNVNWYQFCIRQHVNIWLCLFMNWTCSCTQGVQFQYISDNSNCKWFTDPSIQVHVTCWQDGFVLPTTEDLAFLQLPHWSCYPWDNACSGTVLWTYLCRSWQLCQNTSWNIWPGKIYFFQYRWVLFSQSRYSKQWTTFHYVPLTVVVVPLRGSDWPEGTVRYVVEASYCRSGNFRY